MILRSRFGRFTRGRSGFLAWLRRLPLGMLSLLVVVLPPDTFLPAVLDPSPSHRTPGMDAVRRMSVCYDLTWPGLRQLNRLAGRPLHGPILQYREGVGPDLADAQRPSFFSKVAHNHGRYL